MLDVDISKMIEEKLRLSGLPFLFPGCCFSFLLLDLATLLLSACTLGCSALVSR